LGPDRIDLEFSRESARLLVRAISAAPRVFCLVGQTAVETGCAAPAATVHQLEIALPEVEVELPHGLPLPGASASQLKAISERRSSGEYEIDFAAPADSVYELPVRLNRANVKVRGAELAGGTLRIHFPSGSGFQRLPVTFTW